MSDFTKLEQVSYDDISDCVDDYFTNKIQIMKELPLECQINYDCYNETLKNLYFYYLDHEDIARIPDIFYEDYIISKTEAIFKMNYHKNLMKDIKDNVKIII